jgi:SAM-dependent methyltransferase
VERRTWDAYLDEFHARRPGITEDVLGSARAGGTTPYGWLLEAVAPDVRLLDLACGSGPLLGAGWAGAWVGVDRSPAELGRARRHDGATVVAAEAPRLPFAPRSFGAVACSMALMVIEPLEECLDEAVRVLAPGGTLVLLLPGGPAPLRSRDTWMWARLLAAVRTARLTYPNDRAMRRLDAPLGSRGLRVEADERRRFPVRFADGADTDRFVASLYLPGSAPRRMEAARRVARGWVGAELGVPLRRVVARAGPRPAT